MNAKQLRRLRVLPGDILTVRGAVSVGEIIQLRKHFDDKVTVAQIPSKDFLARIPFEILERIYFGAKQSFEAQKFVELGEDAVRVSIPVSEVRAMLQEIDDFMGQDMRREFENEFPGNGDPLLVEEKARLEKFYSAIQRIREGLAPIDALQKFHALKKAEDDKLNASKIQ